MEEQIKGLVPHVLSFIISEYCKYAFLVAYEKEFPDLKGLVPADSIAPEDFELLEAVDNDIVKSLLNSIEKVSECSRIFIMINNLDEIEVYENEDYNQLASDNYFTYIIDWENKDYNEVLMNIHVLYFSVANLLYHTACQLKTGEIEMPESFYNDNEFIDVYSDILNQKIQSEDKNVGILYDLIVNLNSDLLSIDLLH